MGKSYKDANWRGCLDDHDVVGAQVTLPLPSRKRRGVVAQHPDDVEQKFIKIAESAREMLEEKQTPRSPAPSAPVSWPQPPSPASSSPTEPDSDVRQLTVTEQQLLQDIDLFVDRFSEILADDDAVQGFGETG